MRRDGERAVFPTVSLGGTSFTHRLRWVVPIGILAIAAIMRLAGLDKSLWLDEAGSLAQAQAADFIATARNYDHPPLYFAMLRAGLQLTPSYTLLRLLSVAFGLGTVAVFCFCFDQRDRLAGWCGALLLAVLPGFVSHSQELRQYALLSFTFSVALLFSWKLVRHPERPGAFIGLAGALVLAACTHLLTVFFLAALAPVLGWTLRHQRPRTLLRAAAAFVPAALFITFFKTAFLLRTEKSLDEWWMPPLSADLLFQVFQEDTGWSMLVAFANSCNRHLAYSGTAFLVVSAGGAAFVGWTAWARRRPSVAHALLAIAVIYWALMVTYSIVASPIVWPRTMLPGMLPFLLSVGYGVATHPKVRQRTCAVTTLMILAIAMMTPWLRGLAYQPAEDLRAFAAATQRTARAGDVIVLINGVEIALDPYWPLYKAHPLLKLELREPLPSLLAELQEACTRLSDGGAVVLLYRDDPYLHPRRASLDALASQLERDIAPPAEVWSTGTYHLIRYTRRRAHE